MRGEHCPQMRLCIMSIGSPPHARGTPATDAQKAEDFRITPACAGNTNAVFRRHSNCQDHPRMRGEHRHDLSANEADVGSPPHARGTLGRGSVSRGGSRITPACAGNTTAQHHHARGGRDHPRMRGEHICPPPLMEEGLGSPPHARGTQRWQVPPYCLFGITPACAGNTDRRHIHPLLDRDHPRMRGEHI